MDQDQKIIARHCTVCNVRTYPEGAVLIEGVTLWICPKCEEEGDE